MILIGMSHKKHNTRYNICYVLLLHLDIWFYYIKFLSCLYYEFTNYFDKFYYVNSIY